jgi:hypothetical protein
MFGIYWVAAQLAASQEGLSSMELVLVNSKELSPFLRSSIVTQLLEKFPAFYGTRKFITVSNQGG